MRRALLVLVPFLFTLAGSPACAEPSAPSAPASAPTPAPRLSPAPPPRPEPCAEYGALEAGAGNRLNQDWFDHLDARGYARFRSGCVYHWGTTEWLCLNQLWNEEHGWQTSGDGIPQAQPRHKMAAAGLDWQTNPRTQVRWGLSYIAERYGRPTRASLRGRPCHAGY